jgi:S-adenosylmethionine decarboxylase
MYNPGTHIIATLASEKTQLLTTYAAFKMLTDELIIKFDLRSLGEVYHDFNPAGYTGVVCLSESHISVHTWPEYNTLNMDIYLSNYERSNDSTVEKIYKAYVDFFSAAVVNFQTIVR